MTRQWTGEELMDMARGFQNSCVLIAAAELDLFTALKAEALGGEQLAEAIGSDVRATTMLADALTAMGMLEKHQAAYSLAGGLSETLTENADRSELAMARHLGTCLRSWAQLANVVRTGKRAAKIPSVRGGQGDLESFIEAMDEVNRAMAPALVAQITLPPFKHLLDVGGGPATWTIAMLRAAPQAKATLFDLPDVIPIARAHLVRAGLSDRVELVGGNFETDPQLPAGADLAWVSAIIHMNSRRENRDLYVKVHAALAGGGNILIRDVVMDPSRIVPQGGAMFAINMLVNTPAGGTYTFQEIAEDLQSAGFVEVILLHEGQFMDSVVQATRP